MRKITIYLREYVDDSRRRERRRGMIVAIGAVLVALFAAGAFGPAATSERPVPTVTDTATTTQTTVTTQTTATTDTTITTTTTTTIALTPAALFTSPGEFVFGEQLAGSRSDPQPVTVRNDGDEPLSVTGVRLEGAGFEWTNGCNAPLLRGDTCSIAVVSAPQIAGASSAKLVIETNGGTAAVSLSGTAFPIPPLELGTLDFGRQMINRHVEPRSVRFPNKSAMPVAVVTRSITPDNSPFSVIGEPCGVVAPGDGCDVTIVFTPRPGESTAELRIFDPNQNLLALARLTGTGYQREGPFTFNPALIQRPAKKP